MKKLMLVALLIVLIGVPIGKALAAETPENLEPNGLTPPTSGVYHVYTFAPSGFNGFDSTLLVGGLLGFTPVLVVDTVGLVPGPGGNFPIQSTNVSFAPFQVVPLSSAAFRCALPNGQSNICQLFVHHLVADPNHLADFTSTLVVTGPNGNFQFLPPTFTTVVP